MGIKGMSMLSREAKVPRGGLTVTEVLRQKLNNMGRNAINRTADTVMNIFAGLITGKTLEKGVQARQEQRQTATEKVRNIRYEPESIGLNQKKVQVNEDNGKIVVSGVLDAASKNVVMTVVHKYFGSNDILDRVWAYRPEQAPAGQAPGNRQGL